MTNTPSVAGKSLNNFLRKFLFVLPHEVLDLRNQSSAGIEAELQPRFSQALAVRE